VEGLDLAGSTKGPVGHLLSLWAIKMTGGDVFSSIEGKIGENVDLAVEKARQEQISLTEAAVQIATDRVYQVMKRRRYI